MTVLTREPEAPPVPESEWRLPGPFSRLKKSLRTLFNRPRLFRNYKRGQTVVEGAWPDRLYIEITNVCNLDCIMCPTGLGVLGRSKGHMKWPLFKLVVDEMAPHVKTTTLHIWGEALLHPKLARFIRYARHKGIRVSLSTNATVLDEQRAREIIEAGLSEIYLCLDGMDAKTYETIRRKADFQVTKRNIERFIEIRRGYAQGPKTYVQLIEMAPTREQTEDFRRFWSRPGVDRVNIKAFDSWGNQVKEIRALRPQEGPKKKLPKRTHCPLLWYHCHVYHDGTVTCCDRDYSAAWPLGNVWKERGVMKVWNGPRMQELRAKHLRRDTRDVPPCAACTEWAWWKPGPFTSKGNSPQDR